MPNDIAVGDRIEHNLLPGFQMKVLDIEPCEPPDHDSYKIVDPEGSEDWLCGHEVRKAD
jgi:hypothetical protein